MPALAPIQPLHPLPQIELSIDLAVMVQDLQEAIIGMPEAPLLFQRAHRLVAIAYGVKPPPWLFRHQDAPTIAEAKQAYLRQLASQAATCIKMKKDRKGQSAALAAFLSPFAKYAHRGKSPGFSIEANTPGSGKGLLVDVISTAATGLPAPCWTQTTQSSPKLPLPLWGIQPVQEVLPSSNNGNCGVKRACGSRRRVCLGR